ncbi:MAG: hypothetical protein HY319_13050 [Armatimonadetes bacterium]|nr:hypothetical protein [Armatimonadota bacterium]
MATIQSPYYPQFASMQLSIQGQYHQNGGVGGYQGGGYQLNSMLASRRLESLYTGLSHRGGCCCCCCRHSGVNQGQGIEMYGYGRTRRIEEDPHGVAQSGQGIRSNLANSPEAMLAINDILDDGKKNMKPDELAKALKEKYGIQAEVGDIKVAGKDGKEVTKQGLKFGNGDFFIDGNGDGQLGAGDYKFNDAVKALQDKYGLSTEDVKSITDRMKAQATAAAEWDKGGGFPPGLVSPYGPGFRPPMPFPNYGMNQGWMFMFARAYEMAPPGQYRYA